ncbi:MAG: phenylalanine--tRNA ligase subunit beta [Acidobacteria bacterium RIFCSPLOWO2_02_FULL_68_18]|nr:MAG: phenylalanine--tRNA ligase subunit beta [Acidobacteria bacterium RIFCSPLOWO2_02_FULL_68_18]OFW51996.1 MAG: phenylalanine--tRNA ligase subunit beta [Acidobacteria bacterium RIFCSPLOWO2_12_FULL_68_19]
MRALLSWLREFVDVPGTAEEVARLMSLRGFAVEAIEPFGPGDTVIDFEVTANRPDCMSMAGMAREVAAAHGLRLRTPGPPPAAARPPRTPARVRRKGPAVLDIVIENPGLCPRYVGAVADVEVGPSPPWMQTRLQAAGIRPINNIVDVTNYVMVEMGQPMHAFDHARLAGAEIRIRTARPGETLRTLDGQPRTLSPDMLAIADAERATAVAGVMGGGDSEVTPATKTIVLESAYFDPLSIRRTSKTLGLKTDASMRFERGADPGCPAAAMARALELIERIGAGRGRGALIDRYPKRMKPVVLRLRRERIAGLLGCPIPDRDVKRILDRLGFTLGVVAGGWRVVVPSRRVDVTREVDLIEEVARHYGFDRLPTTFPALTAAAPPIDPRIARARHLRELLTAAGFFEAVTFGFVAERAAAPFAAGGDLVPIANPLSELFAVLRPSLLPGLVDAVAHNRRREQRDIRLFEIGARFTQRGGERLALACVWTGAAAPEHWSGTGRPVDFFDAKAVVERVGQALGAEVRTTPSQEPWLAPGRSAAVMANGARAGVVGQLADTLVDAHGLPRSDAVYAVELDLDALAPLAGRVVRVEPLPRYPSVTRDISILIDDTLPASDVRRTIGGAAPPTLVQVAEFDRYQGKGISPGKVSLSLRLTFRSSDRTLTDGEVQSAMDDVLAALKEAHGAVQR